MVDRIEKTNPNIYRVQESKDATEDNASNGGDGDQEDKGDSFDKLSNKTDWQVLFDKSHLWQRNTQVKVEDIDKIKFLGVNIKSNPALLNIRVFMFDGTVIPSAYLSVPLPFALKIKNTKKMAHLDVNSLTTESSLWLTVPTDETLLDDEITRVNYDTTERTFSQTIKYMISRKNLVQKLGLQDPVSKRMNSEIVWMYLTAIIVLSAVFFGIVYMIS